MKGKRYFTLLDLRDAFNQIRIAAGNESKTAFRTRYGLFEYLVMPFELTKAPAPFQSYINVYIQDFLDLFTVCYLDDILSYSDTFDDYIQHVCKVLQRLSEYGLYIKLEKCQFHAQQVNFLGFVISPEGISMHPDHISTITEWPILESIYNVQIFLGFANFYR